VPLPVADFSIQESAAAGEPVALRDSSTGATAWLWNFGDGATSNERNSVYAFARGGSFLIQLTAVNQAGAAAATRAITIAEPAKALPEPLSRARLPRRVTPRP